MCWVRVTSSNSALSLTVANSVPHFLALQLGIGIKMFSKLHSKIARVLDLFERYPSKKYIESVLCDKYHWFVFKFTSHFFLFKKYSPMF